MIKASLLILLAMLAPVCAKTIIAPDGASKSVQSSIDSAVAGDIVQVPAGTFSNWDVNVSQPITLQGAGAGETIIKGRGVTPVLHVLSSTGTSRLTGFTFDGGTVQSVMVTYRGGGAGLVDHCEFIGGGGSEMMHNEGFGASESEKAKGWSSDLTPGSLDALYVEDCVFSKNPQRDDYFWGCCAMQGYYGSRTVMRDNTLNYIHIDQHGNTNIGARWFEIYDNTFTIPTEGSANQSEYIVLRGGSGVVYNNRVTGGKNLGWGGIKLYEDFNESPPVYLGRGWKQNPSPIYIWAVDPKMQVGGTANVKANRDYFVSDTQPAAMKVWQRSADNANTTYNFIPAVYPHPMNTASGIAPQPTPTPPRPTPSPSSTPPQPTPTPTPKPPMNAAYTEWLDSLAQFIHDHPAVPDKPND